MESRKVTLIERFNKLVKEYKDCDSFTKDIVFGHLLGIKTSCHLLFGLDDDTTKHMDAVIKSLFQIK